MFQILAAWVGSVGGIRGGILPKIKLNTTVKYFDFKSGPPVGNFINLAGEARNFEHTSR